MSILSSQPFEKSLPSHSREPSIKQARTLTGYKFQDRQLPAQKPWMKTVKDENNTTKFLSPVICDPLFDFINLDDFKDDEKLQRNFEEVLKIHKMGFLVKIVKQSWFPGLICIPIFHRQRCLALWTQTSRVQSLCSEVNRNFYGRLLPISVTKCDLLTKLLNPDRKKTAGRPCKPFFSNKPVEPERYLDDVGKTTRPIPIAELVDIDEQFRKYQKTFLNELKANGKTSGGQRQTNSPVSKYHTVDDLKVQEEVFEERLENIFDGETLDNIFDGETLDNIFDGETLDKGKNSSDECIDEELNFNSTLCSPRSHDKACYIKHSKEAKSSSCRTASQLQAGLMITSNSKGTNPILRTKVKLKPNKLTKLKIIPRNITKTRRQAPRTSRQSASPDVTLNVAYEKKLAELRQKKLAFDKETSKQVVCSKPGSVSNDQPDPGIINPAWLKSLVENENQQEEKIKTYKQDLTRAFCFSYFELLRKVK